MDVRHNFRASENLFKSLKDQNPNSSVVLEYNGDGTTKHWVVIDKNGNVNSKSGSCNRSVYVGNTVEIEKLAVEQAKEIRMLKSKISDLWSTLVVSLIALTLCVALFHK